MLLLGTRLINTPVMSIQTGSQVASTKMPVIDPYTLRIMAYEVDGPLLAERPSFIRIADIRELSDIGMIIDSSDELVIPSDVLKLQELYELDFHLIGLRVRDIHGKKLGKVEDFTLDTDDFTIQQLTVRAGLLTSLSTTGHVIHRSQITKVTRSEIIVKSTEKKLTNLSTIGSIHQTYTNPFRKPSEAQPESSNVSAH
jgi:uncharacterized protein YrrD